MTAASLRLLLSTLIDYTGLFPPEDLPLPAAVTAYEQYSKTSTRWMLGRFVLSLTHLPEFEAYLDYLDQQYAAAFWPLSVILEPSLPALESLAPWLEKQNRFTISALEFRVGEVDAIASLLPHLPPHSDLFFEVPLNDALPDYVAVLQGTRAAVKIRTGGLTANTFPTIETLAQGLVTCATARIPFKATAGLNHPIRSWHPVANGESIKMHGFLNLAIAAAFAYGYSSPVDEVASILHIDTLDALTFLEHEIICSRPLWSQALWPQTSRPPTVDSHLPLEILARVRSRYFLGISSASFQDPLAELFKLRLLIDGLSVSSSRSLD